MTPLSPAPLSGYGKAFRIKWVLGNALAHGLGVSLPILWADGVANLVSAQDYISYAVTAFATFGIWVGFAQWLILRQIVPLPGRWILFASLAPMISAILPLSLISISPFALFLLLITYPLGLSVCQWTLWQRIFQPAWEWIITSCLAIALSLVTGSLFGILSHLSLGPQISISVLIGSLSYGMVYGLITDIGLRRLTRYNYTVPNPQNYSGLDVSPDAQSWKVTMLTGLMPIAIWALWILMVLPKPSSKAMEQLNTMPFGIVPFCIFAGLFGYLYLSILIHELGHLLFALSQGYELKAVAIDRWGLVRRGRGWEIFKTRKRFAGGFILSIPKSLKAFSKRSLMTMLFGGPFASFLLFAVSASPLLFPSLVRNHIALWAIAFLSGINLYMTIFNILPLTLGYLRTDGRRLLDLAQNNLQGQRFSASYGYNASLRQGIRPREINLMFIEQVLAIHEKSTDHVTGLLLAYTVALDKGEIELAGRYLDDALESYLYLPEIFRGALLLEGTYFEGYIRQRAELARQWFDKIEEHALIEPAALCRAEAALHLAEGNREEARVLVEKGLAKVRCDRFMKGNAVAEEERLLEIVQAIG